MQPTLPRELTGTGDTTRATVHDPLLERLGRILLDVLSLPGRGGDAASHVLDAVRARVIETGWAAQAPGRPAGALHLWQEDLAKAMLVGDDEGHAGVAAIAGACGLSSGQFSRAFKVGVGMSPQRWRLARKVERAKALMREGHLSLTDIACECGFAEQSHFNHTFLKFVGESPGAWRRREMPDAAPRSTHPRR
ncbi:helix-turn-helix transcriptional regulator [Luteibacter pinisoli]|nr:AraC family transcriptional regulator [Luteibacter pinisoli]